MGWLKSLEDVKLYLKEAVLTSDGASRKDLKEDIKNIVEEIGEDYIAWYEDGTKVYIGNSRRSMFNEDEVLGTERSGNWKSTENSHRGRAIQVKNR